MNDLRGPGELNFESTNLSEAWAKWKRSMQYYLVATCKDRGEDEKVAIFMCMIGRQGQDIRDTFEFELDKDGTEIVTVPMLFQKFEQYCKPRKNLIVERHRFLTRNQEQSETIDQYVTELKTLATSCEWGDIKDDLICSRIVSGIVSTRVRERLLREPELKLTRAIEICQADELSLQQLKLFNNDKEVDLINRPLQQRGKNIAKSQREDKKSKQDYRDESKAWKKCPNCGNKHPKQKCPAFGRQCNKCKKFNHYAKMCRSSGKLSAIETKGSKQEEIGDDFLFLDTIKAAVDETRTQGQNQAEYATLCVNKTEVKLKLDTGAEVNVIPIKTYKILASARRIPLRKPTVNLVAYNGKPVPVKAVCNLQCKYRGEEYDLEFYISEVPSEPVLSVAACKELNLVKFTQELKSESVNDSPSRSTRQFSENEYSEQIRTEYLDVFSGLGCLSRPYHMEVDPKAEPVIHPPRKVPHPLRDQLAETLEDMVKQGVLEKVDGPSDWVNSMVVVQKKDGSLRICIDPKDLNRALKREHYQLPTIEEITARMPGACYFSTLDARSGYWQISLDKESCKLTTFNTPFGRFRFTRMPSGIRSAQEVFHKRIHEIFKDIRGVETDIDDILVWGRTLQEHDDRLKATLDRARECNLKFKLEKCHFRKTSVVYIGHKLTPEGIKPDPEKIEAIVNMPEPEDKKGVQRLLGMVTYVGKFVPNLSEITSPLRELLKKDVAWHWSDRHANAFEEIKTLLSNPQPGVLAYYDVTKSVKLQVDASKSGLGAVLIQSNMPIAYASRSLTSAETRYAQIEKELLAVVFGCNRFRQYIYGKQITVESDHQPLEAIMKKSLDKSPLRLQRMLLNLQSYDVEVKINIDLEMNYI